MPCLCVPAHFRPQRLSSLIESAWVVGVPAADPLQNVPGSAAKCGEERVYPACPGITAAFPSRFVGPKFTGTYGTVLLLAGLMKRRFNSQD
jgi:hypothetical protein